MHFGGTKVLIVEDEYLIASYLAGLLRKAGAKVVGPVASAEAAMALVDEADAAILDIQVNADFTFLVADRLVLEHIPFIFYSGHNDNTVPERLRHIEMVPKISMPDEISKRLFDALG